MYSKSTLFSSVGLKDRAVTAKHLAVMLRSGMTILEALDIAAEAGNTRVRRIVQDVAESVRSGTSLAESMMQHPQAFSSDIISAVRSGEAAGTLPENLEYAADHLEREHELRSKIYGAMLYPIIVSIAAFVLSLVLAFIVLPKIIPLFKGFRVELPATTRALIALSGFLDTYGFIILPTLVIGFFLLVVLLRMRFMNPFTHKLILSFPIIGRVSRSANLARFSRTLGLMLRSGIPVDEALHITAETSPNVYYKKALERVRNEVQMGAPLAEALEKEDTLFPKLVTRMVRVGEASGKFEESFFYISRTYDSEVDIATKSLATAVEPILLCVIGLVVGFLALSIITPIYEITGNIRR